MKYISEFRDPSLIQKTVDELHRLTDGSGRTFRIMEICGGHTHAIYRFGLKDILPPEIEMIHGPGCPVCVLPEARIDAGLELARREGVIMTMFGDMMRVPGKYGTPMDMKAKGADIRMVYSPMDSLTIARNNPDKHVVFFAIGFETTAPATALTLTMARKQGLTNFSVFSNHIVIAPPLRALLDFPDLRLDGFIGPGHVSTIIGCKPYEFIPAEYGKPVVVAGFEPLDLMQAIMMCVRQLTEGRCEVENQYGRVVLWDGNPRALAALEEVFDERETFEWRGLGFIPHSGWKIRDEFAEFDAEKRFVVQEMSVETNTEAACGDVLRGLKKPHDCPLFGTVCTPENPVGALMVSSEGACSAYHQCGQRLREPSMQEAA